MLAPSESQPLHSSVVAHVMAYRAPGQPTDTVSVLMTDSCGLVFLAALLFASQLGIHVQGPVHGVWHPEADAAGCDR